MNDSQLKPNGYHYIIFHFYIKKLLKSSPSSDSKDRFSGFNLQPAQFFRVMVLLTKIKVLNISNQLYLILMWLVVILNV